MIDFSKEPLIVRRWVAIWGEDARQDAWTANKAIWAEKVPASRSLVIAKYCSSEDEYYEFCNEYNLNVDKVPFYSEQLAKIQKCPLRTFRDGTYEVDISGLLFSNRFWLRSDAGRKWCAAYDKKNSVRF